jgi:hypothetical protein
MIEDDSRGGTPPELAGEAARATLHPAPAQIFFEHFSSRLSISKKAC